MTSAESSNNRPFQQDENIAATPPTNLLDSSDGASNENPWAMSGLKHIKRVTIDHYSLAKFVDKPSTRKTSHNKSRKPNHRLQPRIVKSPVFSCLQPIANDPSSRMHDSFWMTKLRLYRLQRNRSEHDFCQDLLVVHREREERLKAQPVVRPVLLECLANSPYLQEKFAKYPGSRELLTQCPDMQQVMAKNLDLLKSNEIPPIDQNIWIDAIGPLQGELITNDDNKEQRVEDYVLEKFLGEGCFGQVQLASKANTEEEFAIKLLDKSRDLRKSYADHASMETKVLKTLNNHRNIITLLDVIHTPTHVCIVMERATMSLQSLIEETDIAQKQPDLLQNVMLGMFRGVNHLHSNFARHGDLKPANILIQTGSQQITRVDADMIRLSDFGYANMRKTRADGAAFYYSRGFSGYQRYAAPEMGGDLCVYEARMTDIWATGCTLLSITYGFPANWWDICKGGMKTSAIKQALAPIERLKPKKMADYLMHDLLFNDLLRVDYKKRATAVQALAHPWFEYKYLLPK